jgi:regulator of sirC expression with transglutaminase-like and TPR domain
VKKTIEQFAALVAPELQDDEIDLLRAALTYAKAEYPELDVEAYVEKVERLAGRVREELKATADTQGVLRTLNRVLFEEEGLHGNRDDYYDPRNSFLNDVLERKTGIPIALSVIYMEVARRVGLAVFGVGMPGDFLLKHYDIEGQQTFIDAFHGGRLLTPEETRLRMKEVY